MRRVARPSATKALVHSFVAGYNSGRVSAIDRLWAPEPYFQWYSTIGPGSRLGSKAYDRTTLDAYFRTRVAPAREARPDQARRRI